MFEACEDEAGIAAAKYDSAFGLGLHGRFDEAIEMLRSSKTLFEKLGDRRAVADSLFGLGLMYRLRGDLEMARETGEKGLAIHREIGDLFGIVSSLCVVGPAATQLGDRDTGRACFLEALAIDEAFGERTGMAFNLDNLADLEIDEGDPVRAMRLAGGSEVIKEGVGGQAPPELITLPDPARARPASPLRGGDLGSMGRGAANELGGGLGVRSRAGGNPMWRWWRSSWSNPASRVATELAHAL